SGSLLLGPELDAFERAAGTFSGGMDVVGVSSGAAAIELALAALGIGPGDEVIVPAFTAVPTASAVCAVGATPVAVDVDIDTALIDIDRALEAVTARTRAFVPVHLYGRPGDLSELTGAGLAIVEDAAQAHGAVTAPVGRAVTYSFYPTKNVGGIGDGGAVATSDPELAAALRRRRAHGMTEQYVHVEVSQNFRMSELEAAWLRLQVPTLAADNARRAAIARHYRSAAPHVAWQSDHPDHVFHLCVARFTDRDGARARLASAGVGTSVHYPLALTQQPAYRDLPGRPCPVAESWAAACVSVPCFPELTDAEVETVADALALVPA
ncbi:MAG: DegT/DnrJ/EryC1/StrS family aminotransferase, partial [Ilumatobacteraceae bacterium]